MIKIATSCYSKSLDWVGPLVLCREEIGRVPAAIPGVYLLQAFDPRRGLYWPVYVGKTADLAARLMQHLDTHSTSPDVLAVRMRVRLYFTAAPVFARCDRDAVEAGLIRLFRPLCNRQVPRTASTYPNLPRLTVGL